MTLQRSVEYHWRQLPTTTTEVAPMPDETGRFLVEPYPPDADNPVDITFRIKREPKGDIPKAQSELKQNIERFLGFLRLNYKADSTIFQEYFEELMTLARLGLVGDKANPVDANRTLNNLLNDFLAKDGAAIKNRHATTTTIYVLCSLAVALFCYWLIATFPQKVSQYLDTKITMFALVMISGALLGVLCSSLIRLWNWSMKDLVNIETQQIATPFRILVAVVISFILFLFIMKDIVSVQVGNVLFKADKLDNLSTLILGILSGLGFENAVAKLTRTVNDMK